MSSAALPADRSGPAERGRFADEGVRRGPTGRPQLLTACRGFYDAYSPELLAVRIAELAMGGFDEIDPPETGAAHAR